jgi:anti-sigma regulatory factor (Ser/Thr protein kinase)
VSLDPPLPHHLPAPRAPMVRDLRLPPLSSSSARARALVAETVHSMGRDDLADDAATIVSELVANAVMHARTDLLLTVASTGTGLRLAVHDGSSLMPHYTGNNETATSGRGLLIIDQLSAEWGVEPRAEGGKVIWVEIEEPFQPAPADLDVDELIASWSDSGEDLASLQDDPQPSARLVTVDIDVHELLESRHETDALVRDLRLLELDAAAQPHHRTPPELVALARRLDRATEEFDDARRQIAAQASAAARAGQTRTTLRLLLAPGAAAAALHFLEACQEADDLTAAGSLLVPPSTQATKDIRWHYVQAIVDQLTG